MYRRRESCTVVLPSLSFQHSIKLKWSDLKLTNDHIINSQRPSKLSSFKQLRCITIKTMIVNVSINILNVQSRVSTKWLNLLRKICAIFAQIFFCELLRYFCAWNAMSFARFCVFFCAICAKPEIFFAKVADETKF